MIAKHTPQRMITAQQETLEKNLGLVVTQIRRVLSKAVPPSRVQDYWDELFQEGCLGLIQAVQNYDADSGMSLATYAIPRIHYAAWRALQRCHETIRLPERHSRRKTRSPNNPDLPPGRSPYRRPKPAGSDNPPSGPLAKRRARAARPRGSAKSEANPQQKFDSRTPQVRSWTPEEMNSIADKSNPWTVPDRCSSGESGGGFVTIGEMLRQKLESAVTEAIQRINASSKSRHNRGKLARMLADQRLLVPDARFQAPLRQIAQETGSSYGRVAACEVLLVAEVRRALSADAEFELLHQASKRHQECMATAIDEELRDALRRCATNRIVGGFAASPRGHRADVLLTVLEKGGVDLEALLRDRTKGLTDDDRACLLSKMPRGETLAPHSLCKHGADK
ncbi:MAG: hypothetical protein KAV82_07485 [Phycisphaerae bacterium]|nr:hypothetical protein [Phycisphaerae bacterium]